MFSFTCTWDSDIKFSIRYLFSRAWEDFRTCCREPSCHPIKVSRIILRFTDPWRNFYVSLFGFYFNGIFIIWIGVGQSRYVWRLLQSQHAISTRCSTGVSFPPEQFGVSVTRGWRQHTWCLHLVYNVQTFCERSFINVDQKSGVHTVTFGEINHPQNPPNVVKFSRWQLQLTVLWRHKLFPSLTHSSHTVLYGTQSSAPPAAGTCLFCGPFYFW